MITTKVLLKQHQHQQYQLGMALVLAHVLVQYRE